MKKTYTLENLDCTHCASKMENQISKISGVESCVVNFLAQKLIIEAEESKFFGIFDKAKKIIKKIEPETEILED